jgi:hypothetical protein
MSVDVVFWSLVLARSVAYTANLRNWTNQSAFRDQ